MELMPGSALLPILCSMLLSTQDATPATLKKLSLAELMDVEVTSVSRTATPLSETAAAVEVITAEDIRRSGARTLAEALILAPNLQVAQANSHDWAITARGFNSASVNAGSLADKLLVMIDGRTVYTPLFAGVFWEVQQVALEDIERIEIVSGPGGTLWGANAVNGVINVITKNAKQTQGGLVSASAGGLAGKNAMVRYGGAIGRDSYYRVYGQRIDGDSTRRVNGADGHDDWNITQGGFRTDWRTSERDTLTVQGDAYEAHQNTPETVYANGQNTLARWTHTISPQSDWVMQVYLDRTVRTFPTAKFREELTTSDFDFQHRFPVRKHSIVWGAGFRHMRDDLHNSASFTFLPAQKTMRLFTAFVQDEFAISKALKLTGGVKVEHNDYTGLEAQPSVRLAWTPHGSSTVWAAVSRAVRSPSRFDSDLSTGTTAPNPDFASESVIAYELGYRVRPSESLSLSISTFYNRYRDLRSINLRATPPPLIFANDQSANSHGVELSAMWHATPWWRLRGGYTYIDKTFHLTSAAASPLSPPFESQDPRDQLIVQSVMDLPLEVQFDVVARYVAELKQTLLNPRIPSYMTADVRLARRFSRWELALLARNLAGPQPQFSSPVAWYEIPRSFVGQVKVAW